MPTELPSDLSAKLDAYIAHKPSSRELVDKLLKKRAAGSEKEAAQVEKMLRWLVEPSSGRAVWWILGVVFLLVAGLVICEMKSERDYAAAVASSRPAVGLVKRMDPGDCFTTPKQSRCLRLELEVHLPEVTPYMATITHIIDIEWLSRVQPGSWLTVGVDPVDPNVVLFNEAAMAVAAPPPPSE